MYIQIYNVYIYILYNYIYVNIYIYTRTFCMCTYSTTWYDIIRVCLKIEYSIPYNSQKHANVVGIILWEVEMICPAKHMMSVRSASPIQDSRATWLGFLYWSRLHKKSAVQVCRSSMAISETDWLEVPTI